MVAAKDEADAEGGGKTGRPAGLSLWPIGVVLLIVVTVALLLVSGLTLLGLSAFGITAVRTPRTVEPKTVFDLIKIVFAAVAGVGGVVALVMAYRRQRVAEATNRLAELGAEVEKSRERREDARHLNERFSTASAQLGHESAAVRLAGVYAIAGLADDWVAQRQTCIDVLCAYLRMSYPPEPAERDTPAALDWAHDREVRHTVIRVVAAHLRDGAATSWQGCDFDFTAVVFDGGDFTGAHFSGGTVRFGYTEFRSGRVDFRGAVFEGSTVHFGFAEFTGGVVDFRGAQFADGRVDFGLAEFIAGRILFGRPDSDGAVFSGANVFFGDAGFSGGEIDFANAKLAGGRIDFGNARFNGSAVRLDQADFAGAVVDFSSVQLLTRPPVLVDGAPVDGLKLPVDHLSKEATTESVSPPPIG